MDGGIRFLDTFVESVAFQKRDERHPLDVGVAVQDTLRSLLTAAYEVERQGRRLPIQEAAQLQDVAQRVWNASTEALWPSPPASDGACGDGGVPPRGVRALYRQLATHYFLLGSGFFAPGRVRERFLLAHPDDGEKAVLMCLKTAKELATNSACAALDAARAAGELLRVAGTVMEMLGSSVPGAAARQSALRLEILFTSLAVLWDVGSWADAVAAAAELRRGVTRSNGYQESFLQLIFTIADDHRAKAAAPAHAAQSLPEEQLRCEESLQGLLALSLDLQKTETRSYQKRRSLIGSTLLQLASSHLRTGQLSEAAEHAKAAYEEMQSLEPLALLVQVYARQPATLREGFEVFQRVVRAACAGSTHGGGTTDLALSEEEVLSLATLLTDAAYNTLTGADRVGSGEAAIADAVVQFVVDALGAPPWRRQDTPFPTRGVVAFLLHVRTKLSVEKLCTLLHRRQQDVADGDNSVNDSRFYFVACWRAGTEEDDCAAGGGTTALSLDARFSCLSVALGFAEVASSREEKESVLIKMSELAFLQLQENAENTPPLQKCFDTMREHGCQSVFAKLALCQAAFTLEKERGTGMTYARDLLFQPAAGGDGERIPATVVVAAFGTLVNYLLSQRLIAEAAEVAAMLTGVGGERNTVADAMSDAERLAFLRVCADGALTTAAEAAVDGEAATHNASGAFNQLLSNIAQVALDLLRSLTGIHGGCVGSVGAARDHTTPEEPAGSEERALAPDVSRWCRMLWYFSSEFISRTDPSLALSIDSGAVELFRAYCCDYGNAASTALLVDRTVHVMDVEFDLFVSGTPSLAVDLLEQYVSLVKECGVPPPSFGGEGGAADTGATAAPSAVLTAAALAEAEVWMRRLVESRSVGYHPPSLVLSHAEANEDASANRCASTSRVADTPRVVEPTATTPAALADWSTHPLNPQRLVALGVQSEELEALAMATGAAAAAVGEDRELTKAAVDLQLAAVTALASWRDCSDGGEELRGDLLPTAAVMLYRAHQLAGHSTEQQLKVSEAAVGVVLREEPPNVCEQAPSAPLCPIERDKAAAAALVASRSGGAGAATAGGEVETVMEYLAVEAWNRAVCLNAAREREEMRRWRALAVSLCSALPSGNRVKLTVLDFAERMPVM